MSVLSSQYIQCEVIQKMLNNQFLICPTPQEFMPSLEAILATQNASGISQSVSDGDGKVKNVKVVYRPRLLESAVTTGSGARACTTSLETFNDYTNYTIDPNLWQSAAEKFTVAELATVCTDDVQSMITGKIALIIDVLERAVATKTANELVSMYGKWGTVAASSATINGSDELVIAQYAVTATKAIDYTSMPVLDLALQQAGYCQAPIIVGGSALFHYAQFVNHGCCSTSGVNVLDLARDFGKAVMYDKRVTAALGSELKSIAFQPGSVALLHYNEAAQVPNLGANYAKFRVNSPRTGLPFDIVMSDVCGTISIVAYVNTKLVALPNDLYSVGDELRGVNMINKILITNPA